MARIILGMKLPRSIPIFIVLWGTLAPALADEDWQVGAAKINITPEQPMAMSGYGSRDHPAEGKLTDLWAKALVLQDASSHRAVLVTLDLVGLHRATSSEICDSLRDSFGFERHQIALCTSHTHTGPVVGDNLGPMAYDTLGPDQQQLVDEYANFLRGKVVTVVGDALERLVPSRLSWGNGRSTFAVNRRNNQESSVPELRTAGELQGPVDHDVPVLAVRDLDDELTAVVFGYACHATTLSFYRWSGDYPGFAQLELEANHPGCIALFFAGCGADQNPLPRRSVELAQYYGRRLATDVDAVLLTAKMLPVTGELVADYREIDLPLDTLPTREQLEADTESSHGYVVNNARRQLAILDSGQSLSQTYPYPIGVWQIGSDVQFITLGGEVVVDYALRLKTELAGTATWVAGYAHDVMAYIPSRRVLREGGYEGKGSMVLYGLPAPWSPKIENAIIDDIHRQLGNGP